MTVRAVAVVTGAGAGIGRGIARGLVRRGYRVAGWGRDLDALRALRAEIERADGSPDDFLPVRADVRRGEEIERAAGETEERLGAVSVLVNNAGVAEYAPVPQLTEEQWDRMMETNLRGPFLVTRRFLPGMLAAGSGHVLMIVSVAAVKAFPGCGAYGAAKAGLLGLTRVLREETKGTGVRVTALLPGATATAIWSKPGAPPAERLMPVAAVADAALWALASDPRIVPEEILLRPEQGDL